MKFGLLEAEIARDSFYQAITRCTSFHVCNRSAWGLGHHSSTFWTHGLPTRKNITALHLSLMYSPAGKYVRNWKFQACTTSYSLALTREGLVVPPLQKVNLIITEVIHVVRPLSAQPVWRKHLVCSTWLFPFELSVYLPRMQTYTHAHIHTTWERTGNA